MSFTTPGSVFAQTSHLREALWHHKHKIQINYMVSIRRPGSFEPIAGYGTIEGSSLWYLKGCRLQGLRSMSAQVYPSVRVSNIWSHLIPV